MKRYRVLNFTFDTRASILASPVLATRPEEVRKTWTRNQQDIRNSLLKEFGEVKAEQKLRDFVDLGSEPISVVSYHNALFGQARNAFCFGAYYPALTAVCALGERILNHLLLAFRDDFRHTGEYKRVFGKKSFNNWNVPIGTLEEWGILLPTVASLFRKLKEVRDRAIHFNPETEQDVRGQALNALRIFRDIVNEQFSAFGGAAWYIPAGIGISFVRKAREQDLFVSRVVLPSCALVGPAHRVQYQPETGRWRAWDETEYPDREVSDDEYIELFKKAQEAYAVTSGSVMIRVRSGEENGAAP